MIFSFSISFIQFSVLPFFHFIGYLSFFIRSKNPPRPSGTPLPGEFHFLILHFIYPFFGSSILPFFHFIGYLSFFIRSKNPPRPSGTLQRGTSCWFVFRVTKRVVRRCSRLGFARRAVYERSEEPTQTYWHHSNEVYQFHILHSNLLPSQRKFEYTKKECLLRVHSLC